MYKTSLKRCVSGFKNKNMQRHPIIMTDADYDYIMNEIERCEKLILNGIVTGNSTDGNNHSEMFYVIFHCVIIRYQYVNII